MANPILFLHPSLEKWSKVVYQHHIGVVGSRGFVGEVLTKYLDQRELKYTRFSLLSGGDAIQLQSIQDIKNYPYISLWTMCLPNGQLDISEIPFDCLMLDLSSDYRNHPNVQYLFPWLDIHPMNHYHLFSNPGCYSSGAIISLYPLISLIKNSRVCVYGFSGHSGAGRDPLKKFPELSQNIIPYQYHKKHAHRREIEDMLGIEISFFPHVIDFKYGIFGIISIDLLDNHMSLEEIKDLFVAFYKNHDHVLVFPDDVESKIHDEEYVLYNFQLVNHLLTFNFSLHNLNTGAALMALKNIELLLNIFN
jgi:N-acetyl-gamma-glutamylphosphate reductase